VHTIGSVISAGETIMLILPEANDMVMQARVKPQEIDQVQAGQVIHVRVPAFNSWLTPKFSADVTQVSADTSWAEANLPPIYIVRLINSACEPAKLGNNKLKPGMPAEAFIHTRAQTPFSSFLKPFTGQFSHALREG